MSSLTAYLRRIEIVTIAEVVEQHKRLDIPMSLEVLKEAAAAYTADNHPQLFTDRGLPFCLVRFAGMDQAAGVTRLWPSRLARYMAGATTRKSAGPIKAGSGP